MGDLIDILKFLALSFFKGLLFALIALAVLLICCGLAFVAYHIPVPLIIIAVLTLLGAVLP